MNTSYLIIEDEAVPAERLRNLVAELRPDYRATGVIDSVEDAVASLRNGAPDLIFMDVELADGNCFEIFDYVRVDAPILFTTAYSEYAVKAFRVNGVDYLLKPIRKIQLEAALRRFEALPRNAPTPEYDALGPTLHTARKKRILVSRGDSYTFLQIPDVAYFVSEDKYTFAHTFAGQRHLVDHTLGKLMPQLDADEFFRLSRSFIVNIRAVGGIRKFFDGRLKVILSGGQPVEVIVSAARREEFLRWVGDDLG